MSWLYWNLDVYKYDPKYKDCMEEVWWKAVTYEPSKNKDFVS